MGKRAKEESTATGRGVIHLTTAKVITTMISLVSAMLLARFRTVEEYGTYSQLLVVITLATALCMLGLPNSINYFLARAEGINERREFLSVYYTLNTILSIGIGLLLLVAIPWIEKYFSNPSIRGFWYFLALYPWARITVSSIGNVLVVYGKTRRLMLVNVVSAGIAVVSVLVIQLLGLAFREYVWLFLAGNIVLAVWIYIQVYHLENGLILLLKLDLMREIFAYSIPIGLASLVGTLNIEMDKLMIGKFMGTEALAYYANAGKELPLTIVASSLTAILLPQMARKLKEGRTDSAIDLWGTSVELSYTIICFCATACFVFAPQIMTILYSEKYLAGVQVFRIYALVLLLRTTYFGMLLNSMGRTKAIFWVSIFALGSNVLLNRLLIDWIGFEGPAVASFVSIFVSILMQLVWTAKTLKYSFKKIFPWGRLGVISVVNIAWGCVATAILGKLNVQTAVVDICLAVVIGLGILVAYSLVMKKRASELWRYLNMAN